MLTQCQGKTTSAMTRKKHMFLHINQQSVLGPHPFNLESIIIISISLYLSIVTIKDSILFYYSTVRKKTGDKPSRQLLISQGVGCSGLSEHGKCCL